MGELIRENGTPLYLQLADELRGQIEEGILKENEKILTEKELSAKYDVSRITVRKALEILSDEDLLTRKQGMGTFVTGKKLVRSLNTLMSFSQNCIQNGEKPGTKFLSADIVNAMPNDVKFLSLQKGEKVIRIRRLRYCNDVPVMLEENHFPRKFAFLLSEDLNQPLFSTLAAHHVIMKTGTKKIGICYARKEEAQELGVKENEALLYMRDTCSDTEGSPVYYGKNIINADRYTYILQLNVDEDEK
ncbi:GntR family transcriptional regulator [Caproicibacter sp. BJN0012]|uniref:GntR family transcriptional regulator n=1 Tax=Caproicibacter sp. BJN0012 TaxID=3110227 RepID=UPI002E10D2FB